MQLAFRRDSSVYLKDGQITKKPSFKLKFENPNPSLLADTARQRDLLSAHFSWILQVSQTINQSPNLVSRFSSHVFSLYFQEVLLNQTLCVKFNSFIPAESSIACSIFVKKL